MKSVQPHWRSKKCKIKGKIFLLVSKPTFLKKTMLTFLLLTALYLAPQYAI